jgi:hypothetical protein
MVSQGRPSPKKIVKDLTAALAEFDAVAAALEENAVAEPAPDGAAL